MIWHDDNELDDVIALAYVYRPVLQHCTWWSLAVTRTDRQTDRRHGQVE